MVTYFTIFIIFIQIVFQGLLYSASDVQDDILWDTIKTSYNEQRYSETISLLREIKNQNTATYILLSRCYEKLGDTIMMRLYLEKAYIIASYTQKKDILVILQSLRSTTTENNFFDKVSCVVAMIPFLFLQIIFLLFLLLFLYKKLNNVIRIFLLIILLIIAYSLKTKYDELSPRALTLKATILYNAPYSGAEIIKKIDENELLYCVTRNNSFLKVKTAQGVCGWVEDDHVIQIIEIDF